MTAISPQVFDDQFQILPVLNVRVWMTEPKTLPEIAHRLPGHGDDLRRDRGGFGWRLGFDLHGETVIASAAALTNFFSTSR